MANIKRTAARLREIKQRQWRQRWGVDYVPAIFANLGEAPGISTGSILRPSKLGRREFHVLSDAELFVSLLALYHPNCWDLHEQFILFPKSREHPLQNHPCAGSIRFPSFVGTMEVFERLGLKRHQTIRIEVGADGAKQIVPYPYFGDLRLFLTDETGPYVVNWPVKRKFADFRGRGPRAKPRPIDDPDDPSSIARQNMEDEYHKYAGIRTQAVAFDQLDTELRLNLRNTFLDDCRELNIGVNQKEDALGLAKTFIGQDVPMYSVAMKIGNAVEIEPLLACGLIHQAIWRRELRVDLFRPILTTNPLHRENRDPIDVYSSWFSR